MGPSLRHSRSRGLVAARLGLLETVPALAGASAGVNDAQLQRREDDMVDDKREQELEPEDSNRLTGRNLKESGGLVGKRDKDDSDFDHLSGEGVDEAPKQS
jgi:hypothetical protein